MHSHGPFITVTKEQETQSCKLGAILLQKDRIAITDMQGPEELRPLPTWKVHTLTGDRKGTWSLSVTRNLRLTFRIDIADREIGDMNLEDYR